MPRALAIAVALIGPAILYVYLNARAGLFVAIISAASLLFFYACLTAQSRRSMGMTPFVLAVALPLTAWTLPVWELLTLLMLLLVPMLARRGGQVAPIYLAALLLLPALDRTIMLGAVKAFDFGLHDALACGAAAALLIHPGWRPATRLTLDLPILALMGLFVFAFGRDTSATNGLRLVANVGLDCGVPYYIVSRSLRTREDIERCMLYLAATAIVLSSILLFEVWTTWPIYNVLYDRFGVDMVLIVKNRGGLLRAGGPFLESTSVAMVLLFCFLAAWPLRHAFRSLLHHRAVLALLLVGLAAPQSRNAWLGLLLGMTWMDLYRRRMGRAVLRVAAAGLAYLGLTSIGQANHEIAETIGLAGTSADTVDYRRRLLERGLEELWHRPVLGYARDELLARLDDMKQGEEIIDFVNMHLYVALSAGLAGLAIFNGVFAFYAWQAWRGRSRGADAAGAFAFAAIATPPFMLLLTSLGGRVQVFVMVFFALGTVVARQKRGSSTALAAHPAATPAPPAPSRTSSSPASNSPTAWSAHQQ